MVPKSIVMHATSMTILLIIRAEDLFMNNKFNFSLESVDLKIKMIELESQQSYLFLVKQIIMLLRSLK